MILSTHGILKPATGDPVAIASHDISFGCYYLTTVKNGAKGGGKIFGSFTEALLAFDNDLIDLRAMIKVMRHDKSGGNIEVLETTAGRLIFNKAIPRDYGFINKVMTKFDLKYIEADILDELGEDVAVKFLDELKSLGFYYATRSGLSWGMDDLKTPPEKPQIIAGADKMIEENKKLYDDGLLTEYERRTKSIQIWNDAKAQLSVLVKKQLTSESPAYMMVESKSRGNWSVLDQMMGMRGIFANPAGELIELPVKDSFKEGLAPLEYFISTHGARKGLVDTALRTATAGYLTRRLVDVAQDVVVLDEDCKDKEGYTLYAADGKFGGEPLGRRSRGRVIVEDIKDHDGNVVLKKGKVIDKETSKKIDELKLDTVKIRSIIKCKSLRGICRLCYGNDLSKNRLVEVGEAVGIVTAQAIGEPGTQLTMRTFHTGGVAGGADITMGLPRVEEIFEARPPQFKAIISEVDGKVLKVEDKGKQRVITIADTSGENIEYIASPNIAISVKAGDLVGRGQQLTEGHVDLRELFKTSGDIDVVARYIIREVQSIYFPTGDSINDKHVELITRQMFARVRVIEAGDTDLLPGDIIEKRRLIEENTKAVDAKKKEATAEQLLLGITKVSLSTDSFLSSASFQETAKVLIESAIVGKEDNLLGLKENVIIGRLIPAGTGYKERFGK